MYKDGTCPTITAADGSMSRGPCPDAYGMVLGMFSFKVSLGINECQLTRTSIRNISRLFVPGNIHVLLLAQSS